MRVRRKEVIEFVAEELAVQPARLTDETTLLGDLGVDGDDGTNFIAAFADRFAVDFSDFDPARYFGPEGLSVLWPLRWLLFALRAGSPERRTGLETLTLGHLIKAAQAGRWELDTSPKRLRQRNHRGRDGRLDC